MRGWRVNQRRLRHWIVAGRTLAVDCLKRDYLRGIKKGAKVSFSAFLMSMNN
ncbi:hypothetical protein QWZ16_11695 [Vibrio ostreicida]|uniref:Uncharacterized protein n=1 Tax=Vibrio ostreicida TaxID=526588 RepID=A0ABT8BT77_9VIBR|nr:hypothetical protein [Vibrio ostreicida]MDN3610367.1 hypothetical protein [Vibrio ostreicida]